MSDIEELTDDERKWLNKGYGRGCSAKALRIIDSQADRIAWLEGMIDLWRCPVHGEFPAGSMYEGTGHHFYAGDNCELKCERVGKRLSLSEALSFRPASACGSEPDHDRATEMQRRRRRPSPA